MATLYFVCGGPAVDVAILDAIFGPMRQDMGSATGIFNRCNQTDGYIGYVISKGFWTFSGDAEMIFRYHDSIARALSQTGLARVLLGQTTSAYFEIIDYRNGMEVARTLDPHTDAGDRQNFSRRKLTLDDLWSAADEVLPKKTAQIHGLTARWFTVTD